MWLPLIVVLMCGGDDLVDPGRISRPSERGMTQLKQLVELGVNGGAITFLPRTKSGPSRLGIKDQKKLDALLIDHQELLTRDLCETLIATSFTMDQSVLLEAVAQTRKESRLLAFAARARAASLAAEGNAPAALKAYEDAATRFERLPAPGWQRVTLLSWAVVLSEQGDSQEALQRQRQALQLVHNSAADTEEIGDIQRAMSGSLQRLGRDQEALKTLQLALAAYDRSEAPLFEKVARTHREIGSIELRLGNSKAAITHYETALSEVRQIENEAARQLAIAKATNDLGWLRQSLGQRSEARQHYEQALDQFQKLKPPPLDLIATVKFSLGGLLFEMGERHAGLDLVLASVNARRDLYGDRHEDVVDAHQQLGTLLQRIRDYREARRNFDEAKRIAELLFGPNHARVAEVWGRLADLAREQNDYPRMLAAASQRLRILREAQSSVDELADAVHEVGAAQYQLGQFSAAVASFTNARDLWQQKFGPQHLQVARAWKSLALALAKVGSELAAIQAHETALKIRSQAMPPDELAVIDSGNGLGSFFYDRGDYQKAAEFHQDALDLLRGLPQATALNKVSTLNNLAMCHYGLRQWTKAVELFDEALEELRLQPKSKAPGEESPEALYGFDPFNLLPSRLTVQVLLQRGMALQHLALQSTEYKPWSQASFSYTAAAVALEQWRIGALETEASRLTSGTDLGDIFPLQIGVQMEVLRRWPTQGKRAEYSREMILKVADISVARNFLRSWTRSQAGTLSGLSPVLRERQDRLSGRLRSLDQQLAEQQAQPANKRDFDRIAQIMGEKSRTSAAQREWEAEVRQQSPRYFELQFPRPVSLEEARDCLKPDEVALLYVVGQAASYLVLVDPHATDPEQTVTTVKLPSASVLSELVAAVTDLGMLSAPVSEDSVLREGYDVLIAPIADRIAGRKLVVIPSGSLVRVPFEALVADFDTNTDRPLFLIERHQVRYAPSLGSLRHLREWQRTRPRPTSPLVAVGDPVYPESDAKTLPRLIHSGDEVREIGRILQAPGHALLLREDADKAHLQSLSDNGALAAARYVHFATHGLLENSEGQTPSLVLSHRQRASAEGYLQLNEIAQLRLNADLVVLSACHTGDGQHFEGEGLHGLARSFLIAGSGAVVCRLWSLNDATTPEFMSDFFRELQESDPPDAMAVHLC